MNVNILGRENLIEYMKTAALREEFSHAYIFEGEKGMGKLFAAKEFAIVRTSSMLNLISQVV